MVSYWANDKRKAEYDTVLILVVVEDGLVPVSVVMLILQLVRLNPCCSGRWSRTFLIGKRYCQTICLNPCCSGRWSRTQILPICRLKICLVLILVVVEDGLVHGTPEVSFTVSDES